MSVKSRFKESVLKHGYKIAKYKMSKRIAKDMWGKQMLKGRKIRELRLHRAYRRFSVYRVDNCILRKEEDNLKLRFVYYRVCRYLLSKEKLRNLKKSRGRFKGNIESRVSVLKVVGALRLLYIIRRVRLDLRILHIDILNEHMFIHMYLQDWFVIISKHLNILKLILSVKCIESMKQLIKFMDIDKLNIIEILKNALLYLEQQILMAFMLGLEYIRGIYKLYVIDLKVLGYNKLQQLFQWSAMPYWKKRWIRKYKKYLQKKWVRKKFLKRRFFERKKIREYFGILRLKNYRFCMKQLKKGSYQKNIGNKSGAFFLIFEGRVSSIIYRLGVIGSMYEVDELVLRGLILVNGVHVYYKNYIVKLGSTITFDKSIKLEMAKKLYTNIKNKQVLGGVLGCFEINYNILTCILWRYPYREELKYPVRIRLGWLQGDNWMLR